MSAYTLEFTPDDNRVASLCLNTGWTLAVLTSLGEPILSLGLTINRSPSGGKLGSAAGEIPGHTFILASLITLTYSGNLHLTSGEMLSTQTIKVLVF